MNSMAVIIVKKVMLISYTQHQQRRLLKPATVKM